MPHATAEQRAEYQAAYYKRNRDRMRAQNQRWHREHAADVKQKVAEWRRANPERVKGHSRSARERNGEAIRASRRARQQRPDVRAVRADSQRARDARKRGVAIEEVDRTVLLRRDQRVCGICHEPVDPQSFHVDHIVPLARGGEHSYANTQVAHPLCNIRKGAKLP